MTSQTGSGGAGGDDVSTASAGAEVVRLPLVIRERDVDYQLQRLVLFRRLLAGCRFSRQRLVREARTDIPPLYRALTWAALLDVTVSPTLPKLHTLKSSSSLHYIVPPSSK